MQIKSSKKVYVLNLFLILFPDNLLSFIYSVTAITERMLT